jgi:hypothetical protein
MTPKELKLKMLDLSDDMLKVVDNLDTLEEKGKLLSFALTFWQEQSEILFPYSRAAGEIKELSKKGMDKQKAMLRDKIKSEK